MRHSYAVHDYRRFLIRTAGMLYRDSSYYEMYDSQLPVVEKYHAQDGGEISA